MLPQDRIGPGQDKLAHEISSDLKEQFDSIENCPKQAQAELDSSKVQRDDSSKNKMAGIFFGLGMNVVWSICPLTLGFTYKYTNIKAYEVIYWKSIFMNIANLLLWRYHYLILPTKKESRKPVSVLEIPEDWRNLVVLRSIFGSLAMWAYFAGSMYIPISKAVVLYYTGPLYVPFLSYMFLQEPTSKMDIFSLSLGFVGIVLINNPFAEQGQGSNELAGILISSIGGLCSSIGWIVIRKMGGKLHFTVAPFYFSIGWTVAGVLFFLIDAQGTTYNVRYNWADILMILVVSMSSFLGQLMQALAYEYEKAAKVAVFYYFQIFLVFMYDLFIFKTSFGYIEILGAALTISCNFWVALLKFLGYKD